jgi:DNA-binding transcriptional LysR family regulator
VIAAPKGWGAKLERNLSALPYAVIEGSEQFEELRRVIQKKTGTEKLSPKERYVCRDSCQCLELVRNGTAAAIVPDIAPVKDLDLVRAPWLKAFERTISVVWHRDFAKQRAFSVLKSLQTFNVSRR